MAGAKTPLEVRNFVEAQRNIKTARDRATKFLTEVAEVFSDATGDPVTLEDGFWILKQALARLQDKGLLTPGGLSWIAENAQRIP